MKGFDIMKNIVKSNTISIVNKEEYIKQLQELQDKYGDNIPENKLDNLHIITKIETIIETNPNKEER